MNVMIVGSGAREHAIGWSLSRSGRARLCFAPGNAGTAELGTNIPGLDPRNPEELAAAASRHRVELVVVGPEEPLGHGVADRLRAQGVAVFGPSRNAALLETSKAFSKSFMQRHGVPTAGSETFRDFASFERHIEGLRAPVVLKKSGLAAGKGVLVSGDRAELLAFGRAVLASDSLLVEERLVGFELSVFAIMDGADYLLLPACADYKNAHDGDTGPNTGGMGAVCPVPAVSEALRRRIEAETIEPTIRGLRAEGLLYRGVLFWGLIVGSDGPRVLEYNVRFGDPETQVLLPSLELDWLELLLRAAGGSLSGMAIPSACSACVGVVVASPGYPGSYPKGMEVGLARFPKEQALLFHASTSRDGAGAVRTGGGRCFTVVGRGTSLEAARERAYAAAREIEFDGAWCRADIGVKHLRPEPGALGNSPGNAAPRT